MDRSFDEIERIEEVIRQIRLFEASDNETTRINEVIERLRLFEDFDLDSLDTIEAVVDLREEFGATIVDRAIRQWEGRPTIGGAQPPGERDPMWDRDLDG